MHEAIKSWIYRRFNLQDDVAALVGLLQEVEQADHTGEQITEVALREQLTWSGQDPSLNNWVVTLTDSASVIAYGMIQKTTDDPNADLYIAVHPTWRRRGIGKQIFAHLLERASELDARALRAYVTTQNEGANLFVRAQGLEAVSTFTRLSLPGIPPFQAPTLPDGFTMRSYEQIERIERIDLYTEALNRCYVDYWGHLQCTQEEVAQMLHHLDHAGIFLLFAPNGTIAGTCRAELSEALTRERGAPSALIDAPGIVAQYRDHEANLALLCLLTAIHWLLPQHPAILELEAWGEAPGTLALYRSLGFTTTKEEISYRRNLQ